MSTEVNGDIIATASTVHLARAVAEQLTSRTRYRFLGPGDVVLTCCPGTLAPVKPGDQAVVAIDGIGKLRKPVRTRGEQRFRQRPATAAADRTSAAADPDITG